MTILEYCLLYTVGVPDWQHGLGLVQFEPVGNQYLNQCIPVTDGKILWGGRIIETIE